MKVTIGRASDCQIRIEHPSVSSRHCTLADTPDGYYIVENLESANHTFINGLRIKIAELHPGDELMLADQKLDYEWLRSSVNQLIIKNKTDFIEEFNQLQLLCEQHEKKLRDINWKYGRKAAFIRSGLSLIPALLGNTILPKASGILSAISTVLVTFFLLYQTNSPKADKERKEETREFQKRYRCPKCGRKLGLDWEIIRMEKRCGNPKCDAILAK